jgi:hypothetical protein
MLQAVDGLTPADLETGWDYVAARSEEIDEAIRDNE